MSSRTSVGASEATVHHRRGMVSRTPRRQESLPDLWGSLERCTNDQRCTLGAMAGYNYWFPKAFGFRLDERWGKASFLIDGAGSTSGAAPCTNSSANRYFASWSPGA